MRVLYILCLLCIGALVLYVYFYPFNRVEMARWCDGELRNRTIKGHVIDLTLGNDAIYKRYESLRQQLIDSGEFVEIHIKVPDNMRDDEFRSRIESVMWNAISTDGLVRIYSKWPKWTNNGRYGIIVLIGPMNEVETVQRNIYSCYRK